jgi:hypothetical protein
LLSFLSPPNSSTTSSEVAQRRQWIYARTLSALLFVGALLDAAVHVVFDPYHVLGFVSEQSLGGLHRPNNTRQAKAELLHRGQFDTILVGSSRVHTGLPTDLPGYSGHIFNLGVPQTNINTLRHILQFATEHPSTKHIVFCMEPEIFRKSSFIPEAFLQSRFNPERNLTEHYLENLFGAGGLEQSYRMFERARGEFTDTTGVFHPIATPDPIALSKKSLNRAVQDIQGYELEQEHFRSLEAVARTARERGIRITFVFSPIHATLLDAYDQQGLGAPFEEIKRQVVRIAHLDTPTFRVLDFTGYSGAVAQPLPGSEVTPVPSEYLEPSHFLPSMGKRVLEVALMQVPATDFGVDLTPANLEAHLKALRQERDTRNRPAVLPKHESL